MGTPSPLHNPLLDPIQRHDRRLGQRHFRDRLLPGLDRLNNHLPQRPTPRRKPLDLPLHLHPRLLPFPLKFNRFFTHNFSAKYTPRTVDFFDNFCLPLVLQISQSIHEKSGARTGLIIGLVPSVFILHFYSFFYRPGGL